MPCNFYLLDEFSNFILICIEILGNYSIMYIRRVTACD